MRSSDGERQRVGVDDPLELAVLAWRLRSIEGSATFRIVLSSTITMTEMQTTNSARHRCGEGSAGVGPGGDVDRHSCRVPSGGSR